jgi:predicted nuclease of predicted toxin-antitoxin system
MRVLLDHDVPHGLRPHFPDAYRVETAQYRGWGDYDDDQLLDVAEADYSVLVTLDTNLVYQQKVDARKIGIILIDIHPVFPDHLLEYMDLIAQCLPVAGDKYSSIAIREEGGYAPDLTPKLTMSLRLVASGAHRPARPTGALCFFWADSCPEKEFANSISPFLRQKETPYDVGAEPEIKILGFEMRILKRLLGSGLCSMRECIVEHLPDVIVGQPVVDVPSLTAM